MCVYTVPLVTILSFIFENSKVTTPPPPLLDPPMHNYEEESNQNNLCQL